MKKLHCCFIALIVVLITSCSSIGDRNNDMKTNNLLFSTEDYTVFSSAHWSHQIRNHFTPYAPSAADAESALSLTKAEITKQSTALKKASDYKLQFTGFINEKNQRIILGNAVCEAFIKEKKMDWKNEYVIVHDGGNCFFQIEMNLDENAVLQLKINAET